jgi:hypothetical protein
MDREKDRLIHDSDATLERAGRLSLDMRQFELMIDAGMFTQEEIETTTLSFLRAMRTVMAYQRRLETAEHELNQDVDDLRRNMVRVIAWTRDFIKSYLNNIADNAEGA